MLKEVSEHWFCEKSFLGTTKIVQHFFDENWKNTTKPVMHGRAIKKLGNVDPIIQVDNDALSPCRWTVPLLLCFHLWNCRNLCCLAFTSAKKYLRYLVVEFALIRLSVEAEVAPHRPAVALCQEFFKTSTTCARSTVSRFSHTRDRFVLQ